MPTVSNLVRPLSWMENVAEWIWVLEVGGKMGK